MTSGSAGLSLLRVARDAMARNNDASAAVHGGLVSSPDPVAQLACNTTPVT